MSESNFNPSKLINKHLLASNPHQSQNDDSDVDHVLSAAWRELDQLFDSRNDQTDKSFSYLLGLWAYFSIYQLEPEPVSEVIGIKKEKDSRRIAYAPKIIHLKGGWKVLEFIDGLITSTGENYGHYTRGPLLRTVEYMVKSLSDRGATKVIFASCLPSVNRFAWVLCNSYGIKTEFSPKEVDYKCQKSVERLSATLR